ncbi:hypothetical protein [Paenibacillus luteus]|uniref:hypothetical protein n=1 Tax=Paenibacillus luteus TaxID=2545753 RepID=UPI0019D58612|nr:hypothetical protein [Paenibacillus luteus]
MNEAASKVKYDLRSSFFMLLASTFRSSIHEAADDRDVNLKHDIRLVIEMPKVGVNRYSSLFKELN